MMKSKNPTKLLKNCTSGSKYTKRDQIHQGKCYTFFTTQNLWHLFGVKLSIASRWCHCKKIKKYRKSGAFIAGCILIVYNDILNAKRINRNRCSAKKEKLEENTNKPCKK